MLILLDWEKVVDKVRHQALFKALHRMNVPDKFINAIKELYKAPTFRVEMVALVSFLGFIIE